MKQHSTYTFILRCSSCMSANPSLKNATKNVTATVASSKTRGTAAKPRLFIFQFDASPKRLDNPVNWSSTQSIATDPSHPFYIRTRRRLAKFDPNKLYWTVKAPVDLSKKAIVRNWAVRRAKEAFRLELERLGWTKDGQVIEQHGKRSLKGALSVLLNKDASIVKADWEHVRKECGLLVQRIVGLQDNVSVKPAREESGARNGIKTRDRFTVSVALRARRGQKQRQLPSATTTRPTTNSTAKQSRRKVQTQRKPRQNDSKNASQSQHSIAKRLKSRLVQHSTAQPEATAQR